MRADSKAISPVIAGGWPPEAAASKNSGCLSQKNLAFDIAIPAESFRGALVYPACAADNSNGTHRGRLYCSWMDLTAAGTTDIFLSYSDNQGSSWSKPVAVADQLAFKVDRFNHWLAVDPVTGDVNLSFYDAS